MVSAVPNSVPYNRVHGENRPSMVSAVPNSVRSCLLLLLGSLEYADYATLQGEKSKNVIKGSVNIWSVELNQ
jgi:hypothetical protein